MWYNTSVEGLSYTISAGVLNEPDPFLVDLVAYGAIAVLFGLVFGQFIRAIRRFHD